MLLTIKHCLVAFGGGVGAKHIFLRNAFDFFSVLKKFSDLFSGAESNGTEDLPRAWVVGVVGAAVASVDFSVLLFKCAAEVNCKPVCHFFSAVFPRFFQSVLRNSL